MDADAVGRYLTRPEHVRATDDHRDDSWKSQVWTGDALDVVWFDGLNHAEMFDSREHRRVLIDIVRNYSRGRSDPISSVP